MSNIVKYFSSTMTGAPVLNGVNGSWAAVTDACLFSGWGLASVDSIVVASNVATVTISAGHTMLQHQVVEIAGAVVTGGGSLNGERRVVSVVSGNVYTFAAPGVSDQTATGAITHKIAAAGWEKPFADSGNVRVYRSPNVAGSRAFYRFDDGRAEPREALMTGYATMSNINTGTEEFGGRVVPKSSVASATSSPWNLWADDRAVLFSTASLASGLRFNGGFGSIVSRKVADPYDGFTNGSAINAWNSSTNARSLGSFDFDRSVGVQMQRDYLGVASNSLAARWVGLPAASQSTGSNGISGSNSIYHLAYPNPPDNALLLERINLAEWTGTASAMRGRLPGVFYIPHTIGANTFGNGMQILGVDGFPGRVFSAVGEQNTGVIVIDSTGPWFED